MSKPKRRRTTPRLPAAFSYAREHLPAAQAILRRHAGVVGIGLGFERKKGRFRGQGPAYVVHVKRKREPRKAAERLPDKIFGIPVDVIERRSAGVRFGAGCFLAESDKTDDYGHLGLIARDPSGALVGLTVGHVAEPSQYPVRLGAGSAGDAISCWAANDTPQPAGTITEAHFDSGQDIARLRFDTSIVGTIDPRLDGQAKAGVPVDVAPLAPQKPQVKLVIPGITWPQGQMTEIDYGGSFDTKSEFGDDDFTGLCTFEFPNINGIEDGWSGSLICDSANRPIALLSFGGTVQPDDASPPRTAAWGWPLAPHYKFWRLSPI